MPTDKNKEDYLIEKKINTSSELEYEKLRSRGIELAQHYSGDTWTDFNLHDPGLTILEYLCYALTDLAYRTGFDLEDILTNADGSIDRKKNHFFTRREILSTSPVTINDFRKLIIDKVPEIYNIWFEPVLSENRMSYCKGLYKVIMQLNHHEVTAFLNNVNEAKEAAFKNFKNGVLHKVRNCINECRNIGEDFEEFIFLNPREIKINAQVVVKSDEMPEELLAEIYTVLYRTINPRIRFYSESELKQKGLSVEEINQGPVLQNGYLQDDELVPRPQFIDPSDLLKGITAVKGVLLIQELSIEVNGKKYERELCPVDKEDFLFFNYSKDDISVHLVNESFRIRVNYSIFLSILNLKLDNVIRVKKSAEHKETVAGSEGNEQFNLKGTYRELHKYFSIQNIFPELYKLKISLEENEHKEFSYGIADIAKVKQLKAFLMMFEQVIANYLSQLANISNIYSSEMDTDHMYTYFTQPVFDVPGANKIINAYHNGVAENSDAAWEKFRNDKNNAYNNFLHNKSETDNLFLNRKNRVFEHILSRFNIELHQYPLQLYKELYNRNKIEGRVTSGLLWKKEIIRNIIPFLRNRNQAFNYGQEDGGKKMGGFHKKMLQLLYINMDSDTLKDNKYEIKPLAPVFDKLSHSASRPLKEPVGNSKKPETFSVTLEGIKYIILKDNAFYHRIPPENSKTPDGGSNLSFEKTGIGFLKDGLNLKNYMILPFQEAGQQIMLLTYKTPGRDYWNIVGKFSEFSSAIKSRNEFISQLRLMNTNSEGFHMVEHILLRPELQSPRFGFTILDEKKHLLCKHMEWVGFAERNRNIAKLIGYPKQKERESQAHFENKFEGICRLAIEHSETPKNLTRLSLLKHEYKERKEALSKIYKHLFYNLNKISDNHLYGYSKIKTLVKRINGGEMDEDFFNFRVTVVLPSWPARFSENPFREFIQRMFIENSPAHIRLNFIWLNVNEMKEFESRYFDWLAAINKDISSLQISEMADAMITWLTNAKPE